MHIGQRMFKSSGYAFHGEIRGIIQLRDGQTRLICQHDDGWVFVFAPEQVKLIEPDPHAGEVVSAAADLAETKLPPFRGTDEPTRYDVPPASDGRGGPHPLAGVPQKALDAATAELRRSDAYAGIDSDDFEPVAHAVLMAGLNAMTDVTDGRGLTREELDQLPWIDVSDTDTLYVHPNGRVKALEAILVEVDKLARDAYIHARGLRRPIEALDRLFRTLTEIQRAVGPALGREGDETPPPKCGHCGYDRGPLGANGWCWACNANHPDGKGADECTLGDEDPAPTLCRVVTARNIGGIEGHGTHYCARTAGHNVPGTHRCRCGHEWPPTR